MASKVLMDDSVFLESDRLFVDLLYNCKFFNGSKHALKALLQRGFNTVMVFLRQNKFALAVASLVQAKQVFQRMACSEGEKYLEEPF